MGDKTRQDLRIAYVCDGGAKLGLGHISRGRALLSRAAGRLIVGAGADIVASLVPDTAIAPWLAPDRPLDPEELPESVVVVDHYGLSEEWIGEVRAHRPVAVVDDWMRPQTDADLVINPNVGAEATFYEDASPADCLCGASYALLRPELATSAGASGASAASGRVLLTLGGGDNALALPVAVDILRARTAAVRGVEVVLGPASSPDQVIPESEGPVPVVLHKAPVDFVALCRSAAVVVCSASTTSHEMAYLGVAFVPVVTVANQKRIGRGWDEVGLAPYVSIDDPGFAERLAEQVGRLVADPDERQRRISLGRTLVDGNGVERVRRALSGLVPGGAGRDA